MHQRQLMMGAAVTCAFLLVGVAPTADPQEHQEQGHNYDPAPAAHAAMRAPSHAAPQGEEHRGPTRYSRVDGTEGLEHSAGDG